jgi:hypothetical protein
MLAYISLGIGLSNMFAGLLVLLTWIELHGHIKNSLTLQNGLQAVVRRLIVSIGLFGMPILIYLFEDNKKSTKIPESYALAWGVACALSLLFLIAGLITLIRRANREKKTSSRRYR